MKMANNEVGIEVFFVILCLNPAFADKNRVQ